MSHKTKRKNTSQRQSHKYLLSIVIAMTIIIAVTVIAFFQPLSIESTPTNNDNASNCYWNWANGDVQAQHIDIMHKAIDNTDYANYELTASAYGEDYVCVNGNDIISSQFHLTDITPEITLPVTLDTFNNPSSLGAHIRLIVNAILSVTDQLPKVKQIKIRFTHNDATTRWTLPLSELPNGIPFGMTDRSLYELGKQ